jgi:hypothetical protein
MPFIIMQQVTMLPFIIVHRFCSMLADIVSSQAHIIFMPPSHISICIVQRGMTIVFIPDAAGMGGFVVMPDIIPGIICRSIVIMFLPPLLIKLRAHKNAPVAHKTKLARQSTEKVRKLLGPSSLKL